jgi:hypothetical protein
MPTALIIELDANYSVPTIVTNSTHGNTVKSTFLYYAPVGWDAVVVACPLAFGVPAYEYVEANADLYDLCICSYYTDIYYAQNFDKIPRLLGLPMFMPMQNNQTTDSVYYQKSNIIYVGAGSTVNVQGRGQRIDTFDIASNLSGGNQTLTSYTTAVVAGKAALLVDAGQTAGQVYKTVREQSANFPAWNNVDGFGKAPTAYTVQSTFEPMPPLGVELYRSTGNTLSVNFTRLATDTPTGVLIYKSGELIATVTTITSTSGNNTLNSFAQYRVTTLVYSSGGSQTFQIALQYADGNSDYYDFNQATVTGFTNNLPTPQNVTPIIPFVEVYAKQNKVWYMPLMMPDSVNVSAYSFLRFNSDPVNLSTNNQSLTVINSNAVQINATPLQMDSDSGYFAFSIDGGTVAGQQVIVSGTLRIDLSS